jgi:hypothetical protein
MILYVNGDSHTAGAEVVNGHAFAGDDPRFLHLGRLPHPENLAYTWGKLLSLALNAGFHCDAESASSNTRILRTTRDWLSKNKNSKKLVVIQWSTWEREEWLIDGVYYQVNGSGIDLVPSAYQEKYKNYVVDTDWNQKTIDAHNDIWNLHQELLGQNIPHIFFNGNTDFSIIGDSRYEGIPGKRTSMAGEIKREWGLNYIGPYDPSMTYNAQIRSAGFETVSSKSWHFGKDGQAWWFRYMLNYIVQHKFI